MENRDRQAWIIAIAMFISLFFLWGGGYNTSPVFLGALLKSFHWSHERVSWIAAVLSLSVGIAGPIAGWLLDRIEARFVMGAGAALAGVGLFAASRAHTFDSLVLAVVILGIGLGSSALLPASLIIANWFGERRGAALGLATAGMESGGMAMSFVCGYIISLHGWRAAYLFLAIPVLLLVLPLLLIVARTRPAGSEAKSVAESARDLPGLEIGEALATRAFWMLVVVELAFGLAIGGTFLHLVAFLEGYGYTERSSALVVSVVLGMAAIGKPSFGAMADRIGGKNALGVSFLMIAAGVFILLGAQDRRLIVVWIIWAGLAGASPVALAPLVLSETLGLKRFGTLFGWLGLILTFGLFAGPLIVGKITDVTGSYTEGFELCSAIALIGAAASFACVAPKSAPRAASTIAASADSI
ncbi:MFS transporter [bacterium]|nr:MFS transporter [bacterium]